MGSPVGAKMPIHPVDRGPAPAALRHPVNPPDRPRYTLIDHTADMAFEVEAKDWPSLLAAATLALSDLVRPLGSFDIWTNRRVSVRGEDREEVLVAWLNEVLYLFESGGFLPALAEVEQADDRRASGVLRGGCTDPALEPPDRVVKAVTFHDLHVEEGGNGRPWRARIVVDL